LIQAVLLPQAPYYSSKKNYDAVYKIVRRANEPIIAFKQKSLEIEELIFRLSYDIY